MPFITDPSGPIAPVLPPPTSKPPTSKPSVIPPNPFVSYVDTGQIARAAQDTINDTARTAYETQLNTSAVDEPIRIVFGTTRVGAAIPRALSYDATTILIICLWGRGENTNIGSFTMGDKTLPAGCTVTHYRGTQVQTADSDLTVGFAAIGTSWSNPLLGYSYSVVKLPAGDGVNIADFHAVIQGVKCFDPRDGTQVYATPTTWKYTDNPTLCLARLLTDATVGLGMVPNSTFWADVTANANLNDVALSGGEKTRTLNLAIEARQGADEWIKTLALYAGCFVVPEGSIYRIIPDAVATSVATFTEANMVEGSFSWKRKDILRRPNLVFVRFTEPTATGNYITSIAPIGADIPALPSGENRRTQVIDMPGLDKYSRANRASIERRNHLYIEDLDMVFTLFDEGLTAQLGDVITVSFGSLFSSKLMRIMGISLTELGRWQISCTEYDPASYSTSVQTTPTYVDTNLASPNNPPTVGAIALTEQIVTTASGALPLSKIVASWPAITTFPFLIGYRITVADPLGVVVDTADVPTNAYISSPLNAFTTYTVSVYARSSIAISASPSTANITLVASGVNSLAAAWSIAITPAGWTYSANAEAFKLWAGDTALRIRSIASRERVETSVYFGPDMLGPGQLTQTLDAGMSTQVSSGIDNTWAVATSPIFDGLNSRTAVFALLNIAKWVALYDAKAICKFYVNDSPSLTGATAVTGWAASGVGRYCRVVISSRLLQFAFSLTSFSLWQIEFDAASIAAMMPTVTDNFQVTTLSTGPLLVNLTTLLGRRYIVCNPPQITPISTIAVTVGSSNLVISETLDNTVEINAFDNSGARVAVLVTVSITGVAA